MLAPVICAGQPHSHISHPDYIPTIFRPSQPGKVSSGTGRHKRYLDRSMRAEIVAKNEKEKAEKEERRKALQDLAQLEMERKEEERRQKEEERRQKEEERRQKEEERRRKEDERTNLRLDDGLRNNDVCENDKEVQTEEDLVSIVESLKKSNAELKRRHFGIELIEGNDAATNFYTGLSAWGIFEHLLSYLSPEVKIGRCLSAREEFFLTLTKLRLNLMFVDLAQRFGISVGTASNIFNKWLEVMFVRMAFLIVWPEKDVVQKNMPPAFKQLYPDCRVIIDCSEIFIRRPTSFVARSQTYSNYKKHNTVKFLIGITPWGTVSFISRCWGGRISDKNLTVESSFLKKLEYGDTVLADRGFSVSEDIATYGAHLQIPAFTRGKNQLTEEEVEKSKELSSVRIHVERVIGLLKNKYKILEGPIQLNLLKHSNDINFAHIDKILLVCSALINLSNPIVS